MKKFLGLTFKSWVCFLSVCLIFCLPFIFQKTFSGWSDLSIIIFGFYIIAGLPWTIFFPAYGFLGLFLNLYLVFLIINSIKNR